MGEVFGPPCVTGVAEDDKKAVHDGPDMDLLLIQT